MLEYIFDAEKFLKDLCKKFEEEELIYDFKVFIDYILKNKVKLTPKYGWIPRKHIYAINSLFKNPKQLDQKIGDKVFKLREEIEYRRFYFLDLLAAASQCLKLDKNILVEGDEYKNFMAMDGLSKKKWLVLSWWFNMDWGYWMLEGDFGELLQKKKFLLGSYLKSWLSKRGKVDFKAMCKDLIKDLELTGTGALKFSNDFIRWGIEYCLLLPLTYFNIIEIVRKKGKYNLDETVGFYIKTSGKFLLEEIITTMEKLRSILN